MAGKADFTEQEWESLQKGVLGAGLLVSLARQEWPDTSSFQEPELVWRMSKSHHVGFIVKSPNYERVGELLKIYSERVRNDYHASAPAREKVRE